MVKLDIGDVDETESTTDHADLGELIEIDLVPGAHPEFETAVRALLVANGVFDTFPSDPLGRRVYVAGLQAAFEGIADDLGVAYIAFDGVPIFEAEP